MCRAGLATIEELLAWDGCWTFSVIKRMVPVAVEIEAENTEQLFAAVRAGAGALFDKRVAEKFQEAIGAIKEQAREAREGGPKKTAAEAFMKVFAKMGLRPQRDSKAKKTKGGA